MIEVVKDSSLPKYEIKCPECDSILHFIDRDEKIVFRNHEHMLFGEWDCYVIICPICGYEIITREKDGEIINDYRKLIENRIDENKVDINEKS